MAHLTDMEELLATIPTAATRDYMREAMNCYMASAYRGCIVLSYIALFDDILGKLGELASVNASAKTIYLEASKRKADQDVYESYLIDQLTSKNLLSGLDSAFLDTLRVLRNKSAHPSGHKPSPEEARFIFFETIARFLSRPILSTTQLVDEIIGRLANSNFFPTTSTSDMKTVVAEEVTSLHKEAIPQLVAKLVASIASPDPIVVKNAGFFLIGLALLNQSEWNTAIQSKLLGAKADDAQYSSIVLQVLSANGGLFQGLTPTCVGRIKAALSKQIDEVTAALPESKLIHPAHTISSIAKHLAEADLLSTFKPELEKLFNKRPYSAYVIDLVKTRPSVFAVYFPIVLGNAGSSEFAAANAFANAIDSLDGTIAGLLSDEQAFQLVVAVIKAADWGSFGANAVLQSKFAEAPTIRAKAVSHVEANKMEAGAYLTEKTSVKKPIDEFVPHYLTDEAAA